MTNTTPSIRLSLSDIVAEYNDKRAAMGDQIAALDEARQAMERACNVGGAFSGEPLFRHDPKVERRHGELVLLKSAWKHVRNGLQVDRIAPASDKRRIDALLENPPPFTIPMIREHFGDYVADPRGSVLRGLAEVFCDLDPAYRSHSKVKIGVKGLPKRVILGGVGSYGSWGRDRLENVLNALAAYQGKPPVTYRELNELLKREDALLVDGEIPPSRYEAQPLPVVGRGVRLRRFSNGNGHLFFDPDTLRDINRALAEYYGDVLPDAEDSGDGKPRGSTAVSKDLQYYPTPAAVVDRVLADAHIRAGARVLEPSCGCGRFLEALREFDRLGIEVDPTRAAQTRAKGHPVLCANFLEHPATPEFDRVVMNPPFYGRHWLKHVRHALRFLKPGGRLVSILPATAWYDGSDLQEMGAKWTDLPVGSFAESGTNVPTGYAMVWA